MSKRDEYVEKMKLELDALNAKIDTLEAKAATVAEDARKNYQEELAKLRHQAKLANGEVAKLRSAGEDKWEAMVGEMENLRDAFKHSFNYFKSQL